MTPNPINTFETTIYNTTQTKKKRTPQNRTLSNISKIHTLQNKISSKRSEFYADLYSINYNLYILYIFAYFCIFVSLRGSSENKPPKPGLTINVLEQLWFYTALKPAGSANHIKTVHSKLTSVAHLMKPYGLQ